MAGMNLFGAQTQAQAQKEQAQQQAAFKRWQADQIVSNAYKQEAMILSKLSLQEKALRTQMEYASAKIQADGRQVIGQTIAKTGGSGAVMDNMGSPYLTMVNTAMRINQADRMNQYQTRKQIEASRRDVKDQLETMWANTSLNAESLRRGGNIIEGSIDANYQATMLTGLTGGMNVGANTYNATKDWSWSWPSFSSPSSSSAPATRSQTWDLTRD